MSVAAEGGGGGGGWGALAPPIVTKGGLSPSNHKKDNLDPDKYRIRVVAI